MNVDPVATCRIATGDGRSIIVHSFDGGVFAVLHELKSAFGFSTDSGFRGYLSKRGISSVANDALKSSLSLRGIVRFLDENAIKMLLEDRLDGDELVRALSDLSRAQDGIADPPSAVPTTDLSSFSSSEVEAEAAVEAEPFSPILSPPVVAAGPNAAPTIVAIRLTLPDGKDWVLDERYEVGKIFALPPFDQGERLKEQLELYREFWEQADVVQRQGPALSVDTTAKRVSRVLLYLGFLGTVIKAVSDPKVLTLEACLDHRAVSAYIEWSERSRKSTPGNMVENLSAFVSVAKFMYRNSPAERENDFARCEIIQRLRTMRNRLSSKMRSVRKTQSDLTDEGRWLSWATFQEAIGELQREFDEAVAASPEPNAAQARLLHDLVLLRIYAASPSRSGEVRTLQFIAFDELLEQKGSNSTVSKYVLDKRMNIITRRDLSCWEIFIADSKTLKHRGVDNVELQEMLFPELDRCLTAYLVKPAYRKLLLAVDANAHTHVFVTVGGKPFAGPHFSQYLGALLERLTGCRATSNILRSSFVTNMMTTSPDESTLSSAASLLRHGSRMQHDIYDRREPALKKQLAQEFISVEPSRKRYEMEPPTSRRTSKKPAIEFERGMLVVVPYRDSDTGEGSFWFGKIMAVNTIEATLMELSRQSDGSYKCNIQSTWSEPTAVLYPVDAVYNAQSNSYELRTPVEDITSLLSE